MTRINVLVTGSGSLYGTAIIQSLLKSTLDLHLVACDTNPRTLGLHLAHKGYIVPPSGQEPDYLKRLREIISQENIHAVFVASARELEFFGVNKSEIEKETGAKVFTNPSKVLKTCMDKWQTVDFLKKNHFYYPRTIRYPEDKKDIVEFIKTSRFPIVIKPRRGSGSQGLCIVNDDYGLRSAIHGKVDIILQEFIPGDQGEFTTGICVGEEGSILSSITLKRFLQDGITIAAVFDDFTNITNYCKQVAQILKPFGPCNFQLRMMEDRPMIFEINPRFSSTTGMRTLLGVNEAEILLRSEILRESVTEPTVHKSWIIRQYTDFLVPIDQMQQLEKDSFLS